MSEHPNSRDPLEVDEWITVITPTGAEITLYRNADAYRVTAIDCYTRRLRDPETYLSEKQARDTARRWTLELLRDTNRFTVRMHREAKTDEYDVDLEASR